MQLIELNNPKNLNNALVEGKKLAIFAIDEEKNALDLISELKISLSQNLQKSDNLIAPALNYIDSYYYKDIKLSFLADLCDISPSYFSRLFASAKNTSISAYILNLRLTRATELLVTTDRSVVDIACSVGYTDCGYFYKLFRKKYSCTPLEYRANHIYLNCEENK